MTVRTISQLPAVTDKSEVNQDCLFELSKPIDSGLSKYTSKKLSYGILNEKIQEDSKDFLEREYSITKGMNLSVLKEEIDNIYKNDVTLSGQVTFAKTPYVGTNEDPLASRSYVDQQMKSDNTTVISPDSAKVFIIKDDDLVFNEDVSYTRSKILKITPNVRGNLILWGWMADQGTDMHPAKAWVALKMVSSATDDTEGTILQVNPWILGTMRNQLQYVAFNVPITSGKNGMYIRIDSGFEVSEETTGSQTAGGSLADSTPNKFVGYVLGKKEN